MSQQSPQFITKEVTSGVIAKQDAFEKHLQLVYKIFLLIRLYVSLPSD